MTPLSLLRIGITPVFAMLVSLPLVYGQTAIEGMDTEFVQLDPFTITTDSDAGYRPTHTSVLTRTNRALIDLPQSVDILPAEFLEDTGPA